MKRVAIIGAGSSGLITLKAALDNLPDWEITCYEKSGSIQGCWGNPYSGFVSTSTKYTTQFSCYPKYDASIDPLRQKSEFFKGEEYGQYLESFAEHFHLKKHIELNTKIEAIKKVGDLWEVQTIDEINLFSHVIVCTGLTEAPKDIDTSISTASSLEELEQVSHKTVVIMGGGESAADLANRLSLPERNNTVYLSLRQGIRVSPRYHPIKGVPSDFLRNRLMLSISQGLRNKIGQKFVEARILYQERFQKIFPQSNKGKKPDLITKRRKEWDFCLTKSSKDSLFNMFHNKSDGFLEAVGEGRIKIIGAPLEGSTNKFYEFQSDKTCSVSPDLLVPMIGYKSNLSELFQDLVQVKEFHLGCTHYQHETLHLVGFARPIIGNIPSISEQQALYITKTIAGKIRRPADIQELYHDERRKLTVTFPQLNLNTIYPVEMFPYCDTLAKLMGTYPRGGSISQRINAQLSPASTLHYSNYSVKPSPVYTPKILNLLLFFIKFIDTIRRR